MAIKVKNVSKVFKVVIKKNFIKDMFFPTYKKITAVNNISFTVQDGESIAILGPNGAGKTTLIKMLSGLMYPTSGEIDINGYIPFKRRKGFLKQIGLVLGNKGASNWDLTPSQNLQLIRDVYEIDKNEFNRRLEMFCKMLNVSHVLNVQTRKLSLGERMKFEIIASLIYKPSVIFLDEPTIGLDVVAKQKMRQFLYEINKKEKITVILTSHDMADVEKLSDRVIVINKGQKIFDGKLETLKSKYAKFKHVKFILRENSNNIKFPDENLIAKREGFVVLYKVKRNMVASIIKKVVDAVHVVDIDILELSLEKIISGIFTNTT